MIFKWNSSIFIKI